MPRDPTRTAGILFLIATGITVAAWIVQTRWGWTPEWFAIAQEIVQVALGIALIRFGRMAAVPALIFVAAVAAYPVIRASSVTVMSVAVVGGLLRILPPALLLLGRVNERRRSAAIAIFVAQQVFELAIKFITVYAIERLQRT